MEARFDERLTVYHDFGIVDQMQEEALLKTL